MSTGECRNTSCTRPLNPVAKSQSPQTLRTRRAQECDTPSRAQSRSLDRAPTSTPASSIIPLTPPWPALLLPRAAHPLPSPPPHRATQPARSAQGAGLLRALRSPHQKCASVSSLAHHLRVVCSALYSGFRSCPTHPCRAFRHSNVRVISCPPPPRGAFRRFIVRVISCPPPTCGVFPPPRCACFPARHLRVVRSATLQ